MDWMNILNQIFDLCIVPLLGLATAVFIAFIKQKMNESKEKVDNELADKYLGMLEMTIIDCVKATNQTYVEALKDKKAFDTEAQKHAFELTKNAVIKILSNEAKIYLAHALGDLDAIIDEKIEATIKDVK
jgi:ABC-type transport system involved in cytochrome bd biosynthesis fused ATPase/permease subunit